MSSSHFKSSNSICQDNFDIDNDNKDQSIDEIENAQAHVEFEENPAMPADAHLEEPSTQASPEEEPAGPVEEDEAAAAG